MKHNIKVNHKDTKQKDEGHTIDAASPNNKHEAKETSRQAIESSRAEHSSGSVDIKKIKSRKLPAYGKKGKSPQGRGLVALITIGGVSFVGGIACMIVALLLPVPEREAIEFPSIPSQAPAEGTYSSLTGETLADPASKNSPAYCVQTPNGTDGARPQAGLTQAGVIFEAIAEAGITRFAAIYQNPTSAVIGPIRSLRSYYLDWDTPFDCTIVHAGGSGDALSAVASGGYKDLTEDYSYMYRGTYRNRLWNNLFTTSENLRRFSENHGYNESNIRGFARMTPDESARNRIDSSAKAKLDITTPTTENTSELSTRVGKINLNFGGSPTFNVNYVYDNDSNAYLRSYQTGNKHEVYKCPNENLGEKDPENVCELVQMAPNVVVAMVVSEGRASDNYHENITTTGSGKAYIFQNGTVIEGTWEKPTKNDQIKFLDSENREVKLAPGQTFVSAIPGYGSIEY